MSSRSQHRKGESANGRKEHAEHLPFSVSDHKEAYAVSSKIQQLFGVVLASVLGLSACTSIYAQVVGGSILGTVADPTGAVIPRARVTIKNVATEISQVAPTDERGNYSAANLLPGNYSITVTAPGFATGVQTGITVTVGSQQIINLKLSVGSTRQEVRVGTVQTGVHLTTSEVSYEIGTTEVRTLPLNGRDWTELATLSPGVVSLNSIQAPTGGQTGGARGNHGFGSQLTISGARPQQSSYRIDGINVNDWTNGSPGGVLGSSTGVDTIEEFSVLTSNYSAAYGRTSGGVINSITRSGTDQFHGSAYDFLRNSIFDAANFFDVTKPPFRRNQFGGSIGGPVLRNHTFFFANYEGVRQSLGVTNIDVVPSQAAAQGMLHNPDGSVYQVNVDPNVAPYLPLWPLPNAGLLGFGDYGTYKFDAQATTNGDFVDARIDQTINSKDSLFGTYQYDGGLTLLPDTLGAIQVGQQKDRQLFAVEERHIFGPGFINSARIGINRVHAHGGYANAALNPLAASSTLYAVPGWTAPQINVAGITSFGGGLKNYGFTLAGFTSLQAYDDAFLTRGKNIWKFGFSAEHMFTSILQDNTNGGQFNFGSFQDFLTNVPQSVAAGLLGSYGPRDYGQALIGAYVTDDYRSTPNLTFNLGVRYEMSTVPTEAHGKLVNMPTMTATAPHIGAPWFQNPTYLNFEPRLGFSWDPFGTGKTAVRGGFGIFDMEPFASEYDLTSFSTAPFTQQGRATSLPQGSFPTGAIAELQAQELVREEYIQPSPKRNYVMAYNINIERELAPNLTMLVAYVGSRGKHMLFRGDDGNMVLPTMTPEGWLWPSPAGAAAPINPNFGRIDYTDWNSSSYYDSLQSQISKAMAHGFEVQGSFTWNKSIDTGSQGNLGDPFNGSISNLFWFDRSYWRAVSDFDTPYNLMVNALWQAPTSKSLNGFEDRMLNGWELGTIFNVQSGLPFTPLIGGDPLGTNDASPYAFPNRSLAGPCRNAVNPGNPFNYIKLQCFSAPNPLTLLGTARRNSLRGPGIIDQDLSIVKNTHLAPERVNMQFRIEMFNVFNHPNFQPPFDNETLFDQSGNPIPGAGLIDATSTTSRQIQFALKVTF